MNLPSLNNLFVNCYICDKCHKILKNNLGNKNLYKNVNIPFCRKIDNSFSDETILTNIEILN